MRERVSDKANSDPTIENMTNVKEESPILNR